MLTKIPKSRIPKPEKEVKGSAALAAWEKEQQEKTAGPEKKYQISLRIPRKYWANELENLNIYERGVLCTYASYMNKGRIAWPSFQTIARILKINWRTVEKSYTGLIEKRVIEFVGKKRKARIVKIL